MCQRYPLTKGSIQDGLIFVDLNLNVDRYKSDFVRSHPSSSLSVLAVLHLVVGAPFMGPSRLRVPRPLACQIRPDRDGLRARWVVPQHGSINGTPTRWPSGAHGERPHSWRRVYVHCEHEGIYLMVKPLRYSAI